MLPGYPAGVADVTSLPDTWVGNHPGLPGPLAPSTGASSCSPKGSSRWSCPRRSASSRCASCSRRELCPHLKEQSVIPLEASGGFVARMKVYDRHYDGRQPMINLYEAPTPLVGEARVPPAGTPVRVGPTHQSM